MRPHNSSVLMLGTNKLQALCLHYFFSATRLRVSLACLGEFHVGIEVKYCSTEQPHGHDEDTPDTTKWQQRVY